MQPDSEQLAELTRQVEIEGNPRILLPIEAPTAATLPASWSSLLARSDAHLYAAESLWKGATELLPGVIGALDSTLQSIALLLTDLKPPSLLYIFTKSGEIFARRGYLPTGVLPPIAKRLSVDLSSLYLIHNGWVDLFSNDSGPLGVQDWRIIGPSQPNSQDGLLEVFRTGGNAMGFDLSEEPASPFIVWSDGDVEHVDDFWKRLDSWISNDLRGMDSNVE